MYQKLESAKANDVSAMARKNYAPTIDVAVANAITVTKEKDSKEKYKQITCRDFAKTGCCERAGCHFLHKIVNPPESKQENKKQDAGEPPKKTPSVCHKCGSDRHRRADCKYTGKCSWCSKDGHNEKVCHSKKIGKPQVLMAANQPDGSRVVGFFLNVQPPKEEINSQANVVIVEPEAQCLTLCQNEPKAPDGMVTERFYADTGANRSVHPNTRAASSFYRLSLNIGIADGSTSMTSEGVGKLLLYTPSGEKMPGFQDVVFVKKAAEKLASVGELCDAGLTCVFDKDGMYTYKADQIEIKGEVFTKDKRDAKSKLYPLTLYRKSGERENVVSLCEVSTDSSAPVLSAKTIEMPQEELPEFIEDAQELPAALLAKTYKNPNLSDVDKYHAKFGDVGIKYIKRAMPSLKIPKQYRCDICIEGKIHKFGHKACLPGMRTEYQPGVCIHSDHSGPYARSLSNARYSQLYLDRGSGYLWVVSQVKKTEHYTSTPRIFLDSRAISGRRVQIFQSDGEGVFISKENRLMLEAEKVRHELSAPYDSNTNPFVERARRTIFEGVCTALIRSGAPARFWGEAEKHKVFTINVLPTVEDPDKSGNFISRKNLLENSRRPFNLEKLMAFGTAATCYVPKERRQGGKEPAQRRSFKGAIVGYSDRVWDFQTRQVKLVSFNFTICHEGYYPFQDKKNWPSDEFSDPTCFSPVLGGVLPISE